MRSVVFPSRHGSGYSYGTSPTTLRAEGKPNVGQPFNGGGGYGANGGGGGNGNGNTTNGTTAAPTLADIAFSPAAGAEFRHVQANEVAWDASRDTGKVIFVREGLLRVYQGLNGARQRLVQLVGAGHWAGAEAIGGNGNGNGSGATTKIVAAETSHVALVDAAKFVQLALADANNGRELVRQLARFAAGLNVQLTESTLLDCERQLLHALLRLSRNGGGNRDGGRVTLRLTQQDLADSLGIARETANGMLQRLAEQQLIQKRRGRISFDVAQLEQAAQKADATAPAVEAQ